MTPRTAKIYAACLGIVVTAVVVAILWNAVREQRQQNPVDTGVVSPSPTVSPTSSATPTPTPTATPSPTATPAASPAVLPETATSFLKTFYAAYAAGDVTALAKKFTPDTGADISMHSRLFTGMDQNGNQGGPTLFVTNTANQKATEYSIVGSTKTVDGWTVSVQEQRVNGGGVALSPVTTTVKLVEEGASWLISGYTLVSTTGKYSAFLSY